MNKQCVTKKTQVQTPGGEGAPCETGEKGRARCTEGFTCEPFENLPEDLPIKFGICVPQTDASKFSDCSWIIHNLTCDL